jgi:hypothetical protein
MAIIEFAARDVAALITHAQSCTTFMHKWDGPVHEPELVLVLVVDQGVSLMSNGLDGSDVSETDATKSSHQMTYATGMSPFKDADWFCTRERVFRDYTGVCHLDVLDQLQTLIDQGHEMLRLAVNGYVVTVFDETEHSFAVKDLCHAPSGLGGVFQVEIKQITSTHALVQNVGNCEDFDDMTPYNVPLDQLRPTALREAA